MFRRRARPGPSRSTRRPSPCAARRPSMPAGPWARAPSRTASCWCTPGSASTEHVGDPVGADRRASRRAAGRTGRRRCRRRCRGSAGRAGRRCVPSRITPVSSSITWPSRRWSGAMNSSLREKTRRTGRLGGAGQGGDVGLVVEFALPAEPAAEVRHDDADVALGHLEGRRNARAGDVGHLGRRPDGHPVALPLGDRRVWLDRDGVGHVGDVALLHDLRRPTPAHASTSPFTIVEREASLSFRTTSSEAE